MFPKTADSAAATSLSVSPSSPPASARNQNRRQPRTAGGRSSGCRSAPPIQSGVTASSSTSSDFKLAMAFPHRCPHSTAGRRAVSDFAQPGVTPEVSQIERHLQAATAKFSRNYPSARGHILRRSSYSKVPFRITIATLK